MTSWPSSKRCGRQVLDLGDKRKAGLSEGDANATAAALVAADVRGMPSRGVGRLQRYVNGLENGRWPQGEDGRWEPGNRERVVEALKGLGFTYVSVDLAGYRAGSMDEVLGEEVSSGDGGGDGREEREEAEGGGEDEDGDGGVGQ